MNLFLVLILHLNIYTSPPHFHTLSFYDWRNTQNVIFSDPDRAFAPALHTWTVAEPVPIAETETTGMPFVPNVPEYVIIETWRTSEATIFEFENGNPSHAFAAVVAVTVVIIPECALIVTEVLVLF